jgi:hypothetical protein
VRRFALLVVGLALGAGSSVGAGGICFVLHLDRFRPAIDWKDVEGVGLIDY